MDGPALYEQCHSGRVTEDHNGRENVYAQPSLVAIGNSAGTSRTRRSAKRGIVNQRTTSRQRIFSGKREMPHYPNPGPIAALQLRSSAQDARVDQRPRQLAGPLPWEGRPDAFEYRP